MLTSGDAWRIVSEHAPRDRWMRVSELYELVRDHYDLDEADRELIAGKGTSTRWHRAVRNALQRQKGSGDLEWDAKAGFRFPART